MLAGIFTVLRANMLNMRFRNTEKTTCPNETLDPCFNQIISLHGHASCRTLVCMFVGYTNRQMKRLLKQVPFVRHCFMCNEISGETRHVITGDGTLSLSLWSLPWWWVCGTAPAVRGYLGSQPAAARLQLWVAQVCRCGPVRANPWAG